MDHYPYQYNVDEIFNKPSKYTGVEKTGILLSQASPWNEGSKGTFGKD